jgi:carboxypeptidase C (cathepsin A)
LHGYIGLPVDYILRSNLRVPPYRFQKALLGNEAETVGRYDARFREFDLDPIGAEADSDPSDDAFGNAYTAAFNRYVREELHYKTSDEYVSGSGEVNEAWKWARGSETSPDSTEVLGDLAQAMTSDRYLRVLSVNGIYDMATPFFGTETLLHHLGIAKPLQSNISFRFYPSGHAIYVNPVAHAQLRADMDAFITAGGAH